MLASQARPQIQRILDPLGRRLAQTGLSPDVVTVVGTIGVSAPRSASSAAASSSGAPSPSRCSSSATCSTASSPARKGTSSSWGAFLDSSCDRIADSAIFGSLAIWYAGDGKSLPLAGAAIYALAAGGVISYVKARAESLGFDCNTGFAERGERLLIVLWSRPPSPASACRGCCPPRSGSSAPPRRSRSASGCATSTSRPSRPSRGPSARPAAPCGASRRAPVATIASAPAFADQDRRGALQPRCTAAGARIAR